ncbi:MAG: hypothetical protein HY919_00185 [Elusimicrobia bacterium]|nr:hypothetical protein [Elusimicrobiota bacterium]
MKIKFLSIFLIISFYFFPFTNLFCEVPPGFEVYFNNPTGTSDANSPGLDFRFKNYVDSASSTTIYAAFYDINNSTVIAALNFALNRGCTVYIIVDSTGAGSPAVLSQILTPTSQEKIRNEKASPQGLMHNKFCVIADSSVWTGSWNTTNNCTYQNNNNAVVIRSTAVAEIYKNEFLEMYDGNRFGSSKTLTTNNGKTEYVNGVKVKIYFSPYSLSVKGSETTNKAIANEIKGTNVITGAREKLYFCLFSFSSAENATTLYDTLAEVKEKGIDVYGILDADQGGNGLTYSKLTSTGVYITFDANPYNLHHKFTVIDPFTTNAKVITGSHNWSTAANDDNDENTLIIYSTGIAKVYYEEFQKLYLQAGPVATPSKKAVDKVIVYPSPAKNKATIGFELSSNVTSVAVKIYTLSGELAKEINPVITPGVYNEILWNCDNDDGEKVASGLYILKIEAATADKTFSATEKFAVIKGEK